MMQHYGRWEMGRMSSGPIIGQQKTVLHLDWSRLVGRSSRIFPNEKPLEK